MVFSSEHIKWLHKSNDKLQTLDGKIVEILDFDCLFDETIMSSWASHLRNHYCLDSNIDVFRNGTSLSRKEFLIKYKFPELHTKLGPAIRAGDFGEILVLDYLQYCKGYWVPRLKYADKSIRDESKKGSDVIGIKFFIEGNESPRDTLAIYEIKTQFSKKNYSILQEAIDHSIKDQIRKGESLSALKQRLIELGQFHESKKVERFQSPTDKPYLEVSGATTIISNQVFDDTLLSSTEARKHPNYENLCLLIIRSDDFMKLIHLLYQKAADEA